MYGSNPFGYSPYGSHRPPAGVSLPGGLGIVRAVLEVIHSIEYVPVTGNLTTSRSAVEVIATASAIAGRYASIGRVALEVIASASVQQHGFIFTGVGVQSASIYVALEPDDWTAGGTIHLMDATNKGISVSGDATTTEIRYSDGASYVSATIPTPTDRILVSVQTGATPSAAKIRVDRADVTSTYGGSTWSVVLMTQMGMIRPPQRPASGQIAEILVYSRILTPSESRRTEDYLWCKWFVDGCVPDPGERDLKQEMLDLEAEGGPEYLTFLTAMCGFAEWYSFINCADGWEPYCPNPGTCPFRKPKPDCYDYALGIGGNMTGVWHDLIGDACVEAQAVAATQGYPSACFPLTATNCTYGATSGTGWIATTSNSPGDCPYSTIRYAIDRRDGACFICGTLTMVAQSWDNCDISPELRDILIAHLPPPVV